MPRLKASAVALELRCTERSRQLFVRLLNLSRLLLELESLLFELGRFLLQLPGQLFRLALFCLRKQSRCSQSRAHPADKNRNEQKNSEGKQISRRRSADLVGRCEKVIVDTEYAEQRCQYARAKANRPA
jgi:hypothetical protein